MELKKVLFSGTVICALASAAMALPKFPAAPPGEPANPATIAPSAPSKAARTPRSSYVVENGPVEPSAPRSMSPLLDCDSSFLRGDLNTDGERTPADVVLLMDCVFVNSAGPFCITCLGDLNCDNQMTPADIVILMRLVLAVADIRIKCPQSP